MPTATTQLAAVIGWPVSHSKSPALHNAAFAAAGVDAVYVAFAVRPESLDEAVAGLAALGALGVSVTVPHKQAVLELCDRVEGPAARIGAVNCLELTDGGQVVGHNTDAGGFVDSLADLSFDPAGKKVVVLGAGGAARAVCAGLEDAGASVTVIARSPDKATWCSPRPWTSATLAELAPSVDLVVDATSTALSAESEKTVPAVVPVDLLPAHCTVASLVYHREPALLASARGRGLATLDGAGMLVHQGARAFAIWTGRPAPIQAMRAALTSVP